MQTTFTSLRRSLSFSDTISLIIEYLRSSIRPLTRSLMVLAGPYILLFLLVDTLLSANAALTEGNYAVRLLVNMAQIVALVPVYTVTYSFLTLSHEQGAYPTVSDVKARALSMVGPSLAAAIGSGFVLVFASLLILPGIWLSVPIALIFSVVYIERAPFWSSLKRSISLVKSRWWWTLGVAFLPGTVVTIVILVAAALIFGVLGLATNLVPSFDESSSLYQILERLLQGVLKGVTYMGTVVGIVSSMAAYFHHVERLEATELAERVAALPDTPEL